MGKGTARKVGSTKGSGVSEKESGKIAKFGGKGKVKRIVKKGGKKNCHMYQNIILP